MRSNDAAKTAAGARSRGARLACWAAALALALAPVAAAAQQPEQPAEESWTDSLFGLFELSPEQELAIARSEHPKILEQFGGTYDDPALSAYLASLVDALGQRSDRPDVDYRVTVIDSPVVNAFALPAGYVYVTRGLLALATDEAEVAGVLAHEIGHVTARHTAKRYGRAQVTGLGATLLGAVLQNSNLGAIGQALGQAAQFGAVAYVQGFSRDQEFEADTLGIQTMTRAGYDPNGMASFLDKLGENTRLQARMLGKPEGSADQFNLLATHPRTGDRVQRAIELADLTGVNEGRVRRNDYLRALDGMLYADNPKQGFVRGRRFAHPELRIEFLAPEGFQLLNSSKAVAGMGPDGATLKFDAAPVGNARDMVDYLTRLWVGEVPLRGVEAFELDGFDAATGFAQLTQRGGAGAEVRFVAIRWDDDTVFRFLFASPAEDGTRWADAFRDSVFSFRRLSEAEAAQLKPRRLRIHTVQQGETVRALAARSAFDSFAEEQFRVLNGMRPTAEVVPGQLVKLVVEDD